MVESVWLAVFGLLLLASFSSAETYTCKDGSPVQEIVGTSPGEIVSPNFPSEYPANEDCTWKIKAPLAHLVRVTITSLDLAGGDTLTLSDGETAFAGNTIAKYSNCLDGQLSLFSTGSNMVIQFKSNAAGADKGFKFTFKIVKKSKVQEDGKVDRICSTSSSINSHSGYIAHQGFPNSVSTKQTCYWYFAVPPFQKKLFASFKMFGLAKKVTDLCEDHYIRHNFAGSSSAYEYLCGCKRPKNIGSAINSGVVNFVTNNKFDNHHPGFLVYFNALDPGTCTDQQSCAQLEDDRDVGFDKNGNILFEKKPVTTTAAPTIPPKKEPAKQFQVNCKRDEIEIVLNITKFPDLQHDTATLRDTSCKATHTNATHIFIRTALDKCGTTHNYSSDGQYINYHNEILVQKQSKDGKSAVITRDHEAVFVFECKYHRSMVMSVVHFTPARARVFTRTESFGNFTYEMEMFKSEKYEEAHKEYPVAVLANQRIYFQTKVIANDSELVLLVDNCKVTPSDNPKDKEFYTLIENGCEHDETLKYDHKLSPVQRFNFNAFYFEVDRDATVHIHCKVRVCRKADKNSRCVKGCPYSKRRRRSPDMEAEDISGTLMIGPLEVRNRGRTGASSGQLSSPEGRTMIVEVLIGVLGFIVMMLVVAVIVVVFKHRRGPKKISLMVDDE